MKKIMIILCLGIFMVLNSFYVSASYDGNITRRGLAISGPDNATESWRTNDKNGVQAAFTSNSIYTQTYTNTSVNGSLYNRILLYFSNSDEDDINYIYFTGHGCATGIDLGANALTPYNSIKNTLDNIPGHFFVFFQCCQSGGAIVNDSNSSKSLSIEQQIINQFFMDDENEDRSFENNAKYTIFCSCESDQVSVYSGDNGYSYATYAWMKGLGYDMRNLCYCSKCADVNYDSIVTAKELHDYAYDYFSTHSYGYEINPTYYSQYYFESVVTCDYLLGDVTRDNCIASSDVLLIRQYVMGSYTFDLRQIQLADVNGDGVISLADVLLVQKYIAGIVL